MLCGGATAYVFACHVAVAQFKDALSEQNAEHVGTFILSGPGVVVEIEQLSSETGYSNLFRSRECRDCVAITCITI